MVWLPGRDGIKMLSMTLLEQPFRQNTHNPSNELTREEMKRFHDEGYIGPLMAVSPEEMAIIRNHIDTVVLQKDGPNPRTRLQSRHMDSRVVCDLASHPAIVGRMRSLYGSDLI